MNPCSLNLIHTSGVKPNLDYKNSVFGMCGSVLTPHTQNSKEVFTDIDTLKAQPHYRDSLILDYLTLMCLLSLPVSQFKPRLF